MAASDFSAEPAIGELGKSWQRCRQQYRLCPGSEAAPIVLSQFELQRLRMPLEHTLAAAAEELDRLKALVEPCGYAVLLAEPGGVIVDRRCRDADADRLRTMALGPARCGPSMRREPTVSAPAFTKGGRSTYTVVSISGAVMTS